MPIIDRPLEIEDIQILAPYLVTALVVALIWCRVMPTGRGKG